MFSCISSFDVAGQNNQQNTFSASPETQLTAIFLYQFSKFIDWPTSHFNVDRNFNICIGDNDPLTKVLKIITKGEFYKDKPIFIKNIRMITNKNTCAIIYFSTANEETLSLLFNFNSPTTLMVTNNEEMLRKGAMIRLKKQGQRIRPQINVKRLKQSHIRINQSLLRISEVFSDE